MSALPEATSLTVRWDARRIDLQVHLLEGAKIALLDTAAPHASLLEALAAAGRGPDDIAVVLNTHAHADHIGGNALLKASGAEICVHRDDAPYVRDPGLFHDRFSGPLARILRGDEAAASERAGYIAQMAGCTAVDRELEEGDVIDLGASLELTVVHLPGHTPGSAGFFWEKEGLLMTGDSVAGLGTPEGSLPLIYDLPSYLRSVDRLLDLPVRELFTTHPYRGLRLPPATVRRGMEVRGFLLDSRELALRLADALHQQSALAGESTLPQIADAVVGSLPAEMGHKKIAELPMPDFTMNTVMWGLHRPPTRGG